MFEFELNIHVFIGKINLFFLSLLMSVNFDTSILQNTKMVNKTPSTYYIKQLIKIQYTFY